jgi:predicted phage-related endonuclease
VLERNCESSHYTTLKKFVIQKFLAQNQRLFMGYLDQQYMPSERVKLMSSDKFDRTKYLGSSDIASILGVSPWQSSFMLYQKKIGEFVEEITPAKQRIFDRGHRWEEIIVEMMVDELSDRGHDVKILARNQRYTDPEFSYMRGEIDVELLIDGEEVNGECKSVNPFAAKEWGDREGEEIPIHYAAQAMFSLMIKPCKRVVFAAVTGFDDAPMIRWMERDNETIQGIRTRSIDFWNRVQTREPPEPTTLDDVKFLYQRDGGLALEADSDLVELCQALKDIKSQVKVAESQAELLATKIKVRMGDAATIISGGRPLCTWKNNKDSRKTNWEGAFDLLQDYASAPIEAVQKAIQEATKVTVGNRVLLLK